MRRLFGLVMVVGCTGAANPIGEAEPVDKPVVEAVARGSVMVPRDGKRFDPAVPIARIPEGALYCDMGTAHYARMTPGDGTCPVCGMDLTMKTSALDASE